MADVGAGQPAEEPAGPEPKDPVASVAARIPRLSAGDRALLRRMNTAELARAAPVVVGLLHHAGRAADAMRPETFRRWALLAHAAAVLSGTGAADPHSPRRPLGRALSDAGYSENRLMRLTTARGPALEDQIVRAARYIAAASTGPADLRTLFNLTDPFDANRAAEKARLDLARSYYAAEYAKDKGKEA